jgi:hypothetical protein
MVARKTKRAPARDTNSTSLTKRHKKNRNLLSELLSKPPNIIGCDQNDMVIQEQLRRIKILQETIRKYEYESDDEGEDEDDEDETMNNDDDDEYVPDTHSIGDLQVTTQPSILGSNIKDRNIRRNNQTIARLEQRIYQIEKSGWSSDDHDFSDDEDDGYAVNEMTDDDEIDDEPDEDDLYFINGNDHIEIDSIEEEEEFEYGSDSE